MAASAFLICMPWTWFGVLLVFFVEKFHITRETASWPKSIATMLSPLSGLVVYALQRRIKTFYIVLLSTILTSAAFTLSAFAPNIFWMTITLGVIHGLGHGLFLTSSTIYTLLHFNKYRAIATSFIFIAFGLSAVVSQFVLTGLVEVYYLEGALLLYGAILMNSFVIVMLARNPSAFRLGGKRNSPGILEDALFKERSYGATDDGNASPKRNTTVLRPNGESDTARKQYLEASPGPLQHAFILCSSWSHPCWRLQWRRVPGDNRRLRDGQRHRA